MPEITITDYIILAFAGLLAGFVDSIAGGGGIITVPALMAVGIPPHFALGTNKLQASFGSFTASAHYIRKNLANLRDCIAGVLFTAIGAALGTWTVQQISPAFLQAAIPLMLVAIFLYLIFSPDFGTLDKHPVMHTQAFYFTAGLALGFYDGFFGPGVGSFWTFVFVLLMGMNLRTATAHTKIMNFTSNIISLVVFIAGGHVLFTAGLIMAIGQLIGATAGSHLVITRGVKFVRIFFLTVVALTIIKLIYDTYLAPAL
ncbi:Sulfite exporter TauE/SafE [Anaerohalosphaera lusitana]|uniref:Probable membrane transporter protein n=1 Tax=Anaerohalosphaera lusitana TaxID=1936003 RepID=A0A1U9NGX8_9BACT|nr:TSUP family transporter [Anaerohalosphaera lusitana]AQT66994.1 Sulfite exporter TauE/SafE [Anaerohalosphaera lusitana]